MKKVIVIAALSMLLTGCLNWSWTKSSSAKPNSDNNTSTKSVEAPTVKNTEVVAPKLAPSGANEMLIPCMKELNALQKVNSVLYQKRSIEFNHIMAESKLYMQVRNNVSANIQQIMDAAYQFRISKTCNHIQTDLTNALVERVVSPAR